MGTADRARPNEPGASAAATGRQGATQQATQSAADRDDAEDKEPAPAVGTGEGAAEGRPLV